MNLKNIFILVFVIFSFSACKTTVKQEGKYTVSFDTLYKQAFMASAVYHNNRYILDSFTGTFDKVIIHEIPDIEVKLILLKEDSKKKQTIVVRGTSNLENAVIDLEYYKADDALLGINLHNGFQRATLSTLGELELLNVLSRDYETVIIGHSLGGAMAGILGAYMVKKEYNIQRIITFGQPKFTDETGALYLKQLPLIRVVNDGDLVTMVPPWTPLTALTGAYQHIGLEIVLNDSDSFKTHAVGDELIMKEKKSFWEVILNDEIDLELHFIDQYLNRLREMKDESIEIEFKPGYEWY